MAQQTPTPSHEDVANSSLTAPEIANSPSLPSFNSADNSKPRKPPTITPRSFTRFFTPKSSVERSSRVGASRQALRDITASATNRRGRKSPRKEVIRLHDGKNTIPTSGMKRKRKKAYSSIPTPDLSSPLKRIRNQSLGLSEDDQSDVEGFESETDTEDPLRPGTAGLTRRKYTQNVISRSRSITGVGGHLQRELYGQIRKPGFLDGGTSRSCTGDWQHETTKFSTIPEDSYLSFNLAAPTDHTIPFCAVGCNTNSLVAVGDEDGGIRFLESASDEKPAFSEAYLSFRPHANAILDLAFSPDDILLATASGDQTSQVIDMPSQQAVYTMAGHLSSVKQICFQPGSSSVIASSSRDGSVQIWDLRCKGFDAPVRDIKVSLDPNATRTPTYQKMTWARSVNTIFGAHIHRQSSVSASSSVNATKPQPSFDAPSKSESPGRRGDVSVTGLAFLRPSRNHLLITASEADASVKLWDLRTTQNHRRSRATPLSSTRQPESHNKYRHFGLTSLSLSGDGGTLYTLCRDNTVYVYSTSHLILGHAPELSSTIVSRARRSGGPEKDGLGPLYGLRHPNFHATTFYVKSAVRAENVDQTELLAVGSSDGTPVIFPTDERYMNRARQSERCEGDSLPLRPKSRPALKRTDSATGLSGRLDDTIPVYQHGTALVRGHGREVTGLTWTKRGELITLSDDFSVRCWREGDEARELRMGGEAEGRRWGCGWAEATDGWDDEDG